ncbi:catechol oxidase [Ranunculus cassubicifolius]
MTLTNLSSSIHLHHTSLKNTQIPNLKQENLARRDVLIGFRIGVGVYGQSVIPSSSPTQQQSPSQSFPQTPSLQLKYRSHPQVLYKPIRTLVSRPKKTFTKNPKMVEFLVVDEIEIQHDGPVIFDVYMANGDHNIVGPELGVFAGSLVNMPFPRVGEEEVESKGSLELGISGLMIDIGAEECESVAVTLVPSLGAVVIGGLRIDAR